MIQSLKRRGALLNGPGGDGCGHRTECELCGAQKLCIDEFDIVACHACQREFLPAGRLMRMP